MDLENHILLIQLELGHISYDEYIDSVPDYEIPKEYATPALFMKNKGKASKRIVKEAEWRHKARMDEIRRNWENR